jgi:hypothetical protein
MGESMCRILHTELNLRIMTGHTARRVFSLTR